MRYTIGGCELDVEARQLHRGAEAVHLSPKAFDLLEILVAARPRAVPKRELYDKLWPDTFVVEANLPMLIREIRTALGDEGKETIRTVHRHGYACAPGPNAPQGAPAAEHVLLRGDREYFLVPGENLVGRDPAARVRIASTSVSRQHASITIDGARATITDLVSKNGTRINGVALERTEVLRDGGVIEFGSVEMVYRWSPGMLATETTE
ncbi:MAG: FHA domain-containing protein [Thermoanaerobaculia bacterium]|jgi:hypothetical protein